MRCAGKTTLTKLHVKGQTSTAVPHVPDARTSTTCFRRQNNLYKGNNRDSNVEIGHKQRWNFFTHLSFFTVRKYIHEKHEPKAKKHIEKKRKERKSKSKKYETHQMFEYFQGFGFTRKNPRRFSRVCLCCCWKFIRRNPQRFSCFGSGMCLFPRENQQPIWRCQCVPEGKGTIFTGREQKHTFLPKTLDEHVRQGHGVGSFEVTPLSCFLFSQLLVSS